jgi:hypothetical protein
MGKCAGAVQILKRDELQQLKNIQVPDALKGVSPPISPDATTHKMLSKKQVYHKLIDGTFLLGEPSKQESSCWKNGFKLVLEKRDDELFYRTGFIIHHAVNSNIYCGWCAFAGFKGTRTADAKKHCEKNCDAGKPVVIENNQPNVPVQSTIPRAFQATKTHPIPPSSKKKIR